MVVDYLEKSFDMATSTATLLITISTAIIAFVTSMLNVKPGEETSLSPKSPGEMKLLLWALALLAFASASGIWTLLAITDILSEGANPPAGTKLADYTILASTIKVPYRFQVLTVIAGVLLMALYIMVRLKRARMVIAGSKAHPKKK